MKFKMRDLTGQVFGRLTVIKRLPNCSIKYCAVWECRCECGVVKAVRGTYLTSKSVKSCGCLARQGSRGKFTMIPTAGRGPSR